MKISKARCRVVVAWETPRTSSAVKKVRSGDWWGAVAIVVIALSNQPKIVDSILKDPSHLNDENVATAYCP